ncbi:MAG: hydantoinase B/oxoprolinase family protein [Alphaproteobacteria bacterium]|nr:hydantoinase B/oxoprolinase family protein [Alphaproteobacteria bacterium]MBN9558289.1 hydantoinase B/oxoprolinase family protein [Alphaproteobacteria bacterium]MBN9567560.1 hydantoinase B/oxoprolinase family protein [Alphaproteobacteria bacterium]MBN9571387.1 hydantoinase B/oxoprolinase family protein [Alphaproteobacteria bacterium]MBN9578461.1 hydantoinase B/oxoprolinase family protein [Alphaproteobacteria bacterium]
MHRTNPRLTDPESLESRYPVINGEFSTRHGPDGKGQSRGGDWCAR